MIGATAVTIGRAARTMLLLCTVFGLAIMHTLGHAGVDTQDAGHSRAAAMTTMSATTAFTVSAFVPAAAADACLDDHCPGHDHDQMTAWSVCLAILGGLAVVVLLAIALLAATGPRPAPRGVGGTRRPATRVPPATRTGLTLASTAVLRI